MRYAVTALLALGLLAACDTIDSMEDDNLVGTGVGTAGGALVGGVPGAVAGGAAGYGAAEVIDETDPEGTGGGVFE